jgi:hypothetical protein
MKVNPTAGIVINQEVVQSLQRIKAVVIESKISMAHGAESRWRKEKSYSNTEITLPLIAKAAPIK